MHMAVFQIRRRNSDTLGISFLYFYIKTYIVTPHQNSSTEMVLMRGRGWSGGAMVLGKLPVPGRPTTWIQ